MNTYKIPNSNPPSCHRGFGLIFTAIITLTIAAGIGIPAFVVVVEMSSEQRRVQNQQADFETPLEQLPPITEEERLRAQNGFGNQLEVLTAAGNLLSASLPISGTSGINTNGQRIAEAITLQALPAVDAARTYFDDPNSSWNRNNGADRPSEGTVPTAGLLPGEVSGGTGDVRISLIWDANSDLDLHVIDPCGFETDWTNKERFCLGLKSELDVDNIPGGPDSVENIFWKTDEAPIGTYMYWVQCFSRCDNSPATFTLIRTVDGRRTSTTGILRANKEESEIITFTR